MRALLRFSLPQTLTSLLLQTILWTDSLLLGRLRPAAEVGVYAIVQRLLSPAQTVSTATGQMFAPRIAAEDARGDRSTLEVMLKRVTYWNVSLAIPVFALLLLVPEALLGVFGPAYRTGATALTILAAGQLFNAATGPARPGDQHVRPAVPDAREQRGGGSAQHRRLPDPDPTLRADRAPPAPLPPRSRWST